MSTRRSLAAVFTRDGASAPRWRSAGRIGIIAGACSLAISATVAPGSAIAAPASAFTSANNSASVLANQAPTAAFTARRVEGREWRFNARASVDPDGSIVRYDWDFGDGTTMTTSTAFSFNHLFLLSGTFPVTLTVTDNEGATGTTTHDIVVSNH